MRVVIICVLILVLNASAAAAQGPFNGMTLVSPRTSNDTFLMDASFNVLQTWTGASSPGTFAYLLPNGSILRPCGDDGAAFGAGGVGGRLQIIDANNVVVWDYLFSNDVYIQHHDVHPMPNGNVLVIAWERKTQAEAFAAGRVTAPADGVWPTLIAEIEPVGATGGNIVWEWHLWDHLIQDVDPAKDNYGVIADHPELVDINWPVVPNNSFDHANAIDYHPEFDQIVFSARAMSEVYVIDHSTTTEEAAGHTGGRSGRGGDILYRWGNPEVYHRGTENDRYFYSVHGANWIDPGLPGAGNLLIFNNGNRAGAANDYSGVAEIVPPHDGYGNYYLKEGDDFGPATPIWEYEDPPAFYSQNKGGCYRLPNGNTLICESNDLRVFEVTVTGQTVWAYAPPAELHRCPAYWTTTTAIPETPVGSTHLDQNYPNPFNPVTTIRYAIEVAGHVSLEIYDVNGNRVRTLVSETQTPRAEPFVVTWNGRSETGSPVASGVYFYRLTAKNVSQTRKMVVLK